MSFGLGCADCGGLAPIPEPRNETEVLGDLIFEEGTRIKIEERSDGRRRFVKISVKAQSDPVVSLTANPAQAEVGQTVNVTFTGNITPGSEEIVERKLSGSPDPTTDSFSVVVENVSANLSKTLSVVDKAGVSKSVLAGIRFLSRFFIGYSPKQILAAEDVVPETGALAVSTDQAFGGEKVYNLPNSAAGKNYIYWVYPATMLPIGVPVMGGLQVPVVKQSTTIVVNGVTYYVERTKNSYGESDLTITI